MHRGQQHVEKVSTCIARLQLTWPNLLVFVQRVACIISEKFQKMDRPSTSADIILNVMLVELNGVNETKLNMCPLT